MIVVLWRQRRSSSPPQETPIPISANTVPLITDDVVSPGPSGSKKSAATMLKAVAARPGPTPANQAETSTDGTK